MCGITGSLWTNEAQSISREQLGKMTASLLHRGPDDCGEYFSSHSPSVSKPAVALGFRRLSIIDLQTGHQPIANEDESIWLVFNGEIYNYLELRDQLTYYPFQTTGDTEVILAA